MTFDVAIVGAGPAGTSAALTAAASGLTAVLCERSRFEAGRGRDKVCGEFISAEALPLLERWTPALLETAPAIAGARLIASGRAGAAFSLPQPARGISRLALDAALWRAAGEAGVRLRPQCAIAQATHADGAWQLRTATGEHIAAHAVIWATGRQPASGGERWWGLKARFEGLPQRAEVELYRLRAGYGGVAPVEDGWTNVCCLLHARHVPPPADSADFLSWLTRVEGSEALVARLHGAGQITPTVVTAGIALGPRAALVAGRLMAGDASGFVDPFTGDGIARALLSGQLAAAAIAEGNPAGYAAALQQASGASFRTGARLRAAVLAPGWLQAALLPLVAHPALGKRLVAATRWHAGRGRK